MPIEIRELVVRVKVDEGHKSSTASIDLEKLKRDILRECQREIKREVNKRKVR